MKMNLNVEGIGKVTITDQDYLAQGGEASVYVKDRLAFKIYLDPNKMIPVDKIKELELIQADNVLKPKHILYDGNTPVGYAMDFKKNTHAICKLFTKAFKQRNNISNEDVTSIVEKLQETIEAIHAAKCLVVDLNELNILVNSKFEIPYFIDVDSYQTPSYRATAIMDSIRDHFVKNNKWTRDSDWFSFAVIAFQLWIGIHPYKGSHPDYKPNEWPKRMDDGVSIFDKKSSIPSVCNDFSVIPKSHLAWFKEIFLSNKRCSPPKIGDMSVSILMPQTFNVITASQAFTISLVEECSETIMDVFNFMGINYMISSKRIHKGKSAIPVDVVGFSKVLMCESSSINPVVCKLKDNIMYIEDDKGVVLGDIAANDMMYRNGCIYTVHGGKLMENSFTQFGEKIVHSTRLAANIFDLSTQVFDGVVFQDLVGKMHITLPYEKGKCVILHINELDGYRILNARSEKNICGIMAEKGGIYYNFVITFNAAFNSYNVRTSKDVPYSEINLTVLPNGVTVMAGNTTVEVFKDQNVKVIDNPPFNSTTKLYNYSGGIFYVDGKKIMAAKMRK